MEGKAPIVTAGAGVGVGVGVGVGIAGATSMSPTSPVTPLSAAAYGPAAGAPLAPTMGFHSTKRKRDSMSSPGSPGANDDNDDKRHRQPGVKRACNECRQQKLRCTVVQDPFQSCARCERLKLECKIESNFKRIGKRSKQAEMARQIERMEQLLHQAKAKGFEVDDDDGLQSPIAASSYTHTRNPSLIGSEEAVSSLLHLKTGGQYSLPPAYKYALGPVKLMEEQAGDLFREYFAFYHRFLPFLPNLPPRSYFDQHPLLFWSIIAVGARHWAPDKSLLKALAAPLTHLVWDTIAELPSSYHVVKALCLLCTWRLPASFSSNDPTHVLCGVMMKIATSIGLHRPTHLQDFSRTPIDLNADQIHDRAVAWAVCNMVAQSVGTGYGQPASTLYDWTLAVRPDNKGPFALPVDLAARLRIEMFCDRVSKEMYSNVNDPRGVTGDEHRSMFMRVFGREFYELQRTLEAENQSSQLIRLYLRAALLHLRLAAFYDSPSTSNHTEDLVALWQATKSFLEDITLDTERGLGPDHIVLPHLTNYLQQMLVAGGFSLLRLLDCAFFTPLIDIKLGRVLFNRTIAAIRQTSVAENDLQGRLAELMVQMWNGHKLARQASEGRHSDVPVVVGDSLQLKVRCRHSMSHVYDTIWRWREEFLDKGRSSLETLKQSTNPELTNDSSASSTHMENTPIETPHGLSLAPGILNPAAAAIAAAPALTAAATMPGLSGLGGGILAGDMEFLDTGSHWMLDHLLDFNYAGYAPVEQHV